MAVRPLSRRLPIGSNAASKFSPAGGQGAPYQAGFRWATPPQPNSPRQEGTQGPAASPRKAAPARFSDSQRVPGRRIYSPQAGLPPRPFELTPPRVVITP